MGRATLEGHESLQAPIGRLIPLQRMQHRIKNPWLPSKAPHPTCVRASAGPAHL